MNVIIHATPGAIERLGNETILECPAVLQHKAIEHDDYLHVSGQ